MHVKISNVFFLLLMFQGFGPMILSGQNHDFHYIHKRHSGGGALILSYCQSSEELCFDTLEMRNESQILAGLTLNDKDGNFLGYFDGFRLFDAKKRLAINGDHFGQNSGWGRYWAENVPEQGIPTLNTGLILSTINDSLYVLINSDYEHKKYNGNVGYLLDSGFQIEDCLRSIRYSLVKLLPGGRLEVVQGRKEVLLKRGVFRCEISACKHANGEDWWILFFSLADKKMYSLLLDSETQSMKIDSSDYPGKNTTINTGNGGTIFSPDGNKLAKLHFRVGPIGGRRLPSIIEVMDFDRCSGKVGGNYSIDSFPMTDPFSAFGNIAFSPNGRFLYFTNSIQVLQFDLEELDFLKHPDTIAFWNERYFNDHPAFPNFFSSIWRLPNDQIVIPWFNTSNVHAILEPDKKGAACDFRENYYVGPMSEGMGGNFQLPIYIGPYWPEYRMKPLDIICKDEGADSLTSACLARIMPNPFHEEVRLDCLNSVGYGPGTQLKVYTILGQEVLNASISDYLQEYVINTRNWISGMYVFVISNASSGKKETFKVVKQ